ncbi:MAG TPA: hypothetical protein VNT30_15065 [Stellaceae bacterium]|nr:hypothetical protein [Stellaceae bacterium]
MAVGSARNWVFGAFGIAGTALLTLSALPAGAVPLMSGNSAVSPSAAQSAIQDVRWVNQCRTIRVYRNGPHGRHLVPARSCKRVWVR